MKCDREFFDSAAETYINTWVKSKKKAQRIREIVRKFGIKKGMSVMEAGAGNGQFTPFLLERTKNVTLVDISPKMLKAAKKNLKGRGVKFQRSCVSRVKAGKEKPDIIICFNSFPHFYPKDKVLKKFHSLLKNEGKVVISHSSDRGYINSMHRGYRFDMKKHSIPAKKDMASLLDKAGFKIEKYVNKNYYLLIAKKTGGCPVNGGGINRK